MFIFLDDYREPSDVTWVKLPETYHWVVVRNYEQFVLLIDNLMTPPAFIAFDHDLADAHYEGDFSNPNEKTGMDCAKALVDICLDHGWQIPPFIVHSLNPVGRKNIEMYLENAKKHATTS
jgi:hypothetical protein